MRIKRLLIRVSLPLLLLFVTQTLLAQNREITGKVTDGKDASPVSGASVQVKGTNQGVSTKADGTFSISVPANATTLTVSSVGFKETEVNITNQTSVDVTLEASGADLSEVVVVGYGTVRKRDLTGAVVSVREKDFNKGTFAAPDQLIQGKVAGVQVLNNSGAPGGGTTVKVRGNSAITGSGQPLYVVDGVPLDGRSARPGVDAGFGATPSGNPLNFINPNDIASMEILKDASATAIYGSRAAYGVVLITTKRGASGQPKLDLGVSYGVSNLMRNIEILNADDYKLALTKFNAPAANNKGSDVDALDAILRTANIQTYTAAVSGGNENAKFRLSTSLLDQEGIVRKTDFKKYTVGLNANFKFLEKKNLGIDFNVISSQYVENVAPITNTAGSEGSLIGQALQWNPTESLYKPGNDSLNIAAGGGIINPLAMSEAYNDNSKVTTILGSVSPYIKITKDLEYRMLFSINYSTGVRRSSVASYLNLPAIIDKGRAFISNNELITQQMTHTLNYNKQLSSDFSINALIGYEYMKYTNKGSSMNAFGPDGGGFGNYGLDYTNYIQYSNASSRGISSFIDPVSELQSYFARAVMNLKDKYLLTATFRADGSTKFGSNNAYGYFPSVSASWVISKEEFFKVNFVNDLRVRASYGITGNQEFPSGSSQTRYTFNGPAAIGLANNGNPDLKWQSDEQINFGLDYAIFDNRITGSFDYFVKTTSDLLFPTTPIQPSAPGATVTWKNLDGEVVNKGFEFSINANIVRSKDWSWDLGVNASFIDNKIQNLGAPIRTGALHGQGVSGASVQTIRNGLPINAFFTRAYGGLDKATGQAIYPDGEVFSYQGNPNPTTVMGISTTVAYKQLSLVVNMNGAFGQMIYNNTLNNVINVANLVGGKNISRDIYEDPTQEALSNRVTPSARFIEKGNYMKMANASLSYAIGDIRFIKNATIFLTGQNLFVITKFSGFDPEVNVDKSLNSVPSVGIEYVPYPPARTVTLGVNFSL
ncbi:MAG: SusC/RagA family TonB-linked outer membrane protein [Pedobacter sp.]|nr:MAG: SusC/RagA family TonB-linked outer membrane protein [Pedobacter sp.]